MTWAFELPLREWAVIFANGRVFTCMSLGQQSSDDCFQFQGSSQGENWHWIATGSATSAGHVMSLTGLPRLADSPSSVEVLTAVQGGDFSLIDNRPRSLEEHQARPPLAPLPPPGPPPPDYQRPWILATDPTEHAVIYDDGGVVTIWAHTVETTPTHYRFHVTLDDGADVIMGTATRPGAVCLLVGSPALADHAATAAILAAAYDGDLGPARARGLPAG